MKSESCTLSDCAVLSAVTDVLKCHVMRDFLCKSMPMCRPVITANSSEVCAACISASLASVHISSDGLLLAVCEDACIRTWAIADMLQGTQPEPLTEWTLGNGEIVRQASCSPPKSPALNLIERCTGKSHRHLEIDDVIM